MRATNSFRRRLHGLSDRSRAIGTFFATAIAARGVGIGCQLLLVPVTLHALGPEAFGLWMTLTGFGAMIMFADFGLGQGAQNTLATAFARDDGTEARKLWETSLLLLGAVGLLLFGVVCLAERAVDPATLFNLRDPAVQVESRQAVIAAGFLFCVNFPLGLAQRLAYARQRGWMHNVAQAVGSVIGLVATLVAVRLGWSLPGIIVAAQGPLVLANAGLILVQMRQLGWTDLRWPRFQRRAVRELFGIGIYFGIQQLQLTLSMALPPIVISTWVGAAAVTPFNLAQRLFNLFAVVQNAFMLPLWPAYSDAGARGDFNWIRRAMRRSLGATLIGTVLPMAVGAAVARPVLGAWVGSMRAVPGPALVWLLFAWNAVSFLQQPFGYLLAGLSMVRRQTRFAAISAAASATLMVWWVRGHGADGVVAGMIAGFMPFLILGNLFEVRRVLRLLPTGDASPEAWGKLANAA
ncbi:MAG TPA: lipopolysaccharide biosynthesis protein [Opitutaceae bacterium]|nr:lipopolysaccharide biosynthesis protein [Opitutaceae bacterium]